MGIHFGLQISNPPLVISEESIEIINPASEDASKLSAMAKPAIHSFITPYKYDP